MSPTTYFDHELDGIDKPITNAIRTALGVSGLLMLIIGLVFLVWPVKSAEFIAGIIALYAVLAGLVNLAIGVFSSKLGGWVRFGHLALGALFLLAGIMSFTNLGAAALGLAQPPATVRPRVMRCSRTLSTVSLLNSHLLTASASTRLGTSPSSSHSSAYH